MESTPKLTMNTRDAEFFASHVTHLTGETRTFPSQKVRPGEPPLAPSHQCILAAVVAVSEALRKYIAGRTGDSAAEHVHRLVMYIRDHVKVVSIAVPSDEDAYTIFETLNDRGLELSKADLLKNHLLRSASKQHRTGSKLEQVLESWGRMNVSLDVVSKADATVDFIRYHWISTRGHVRVRDLYKQIKAAVKTSESAAAFARSLAEDAGLYAAIANSDHFTWREHGQNASADISNLITLGVERLRPITLAVVREMRPAEMKKSLYYLVCASARILIASPSPGGVFEKQVADIAPRISSGEIDTAAKLAKTMNREVVPGDKEFQAEFAFANSSKMQLARYYLRSLDAGATNQSFPARAPHAGGDTVEHILPKAGGSNWQDVEEEDRRAYRNRLGNFVLLSSDDNSRLGNSSFGAKKKVFAKSKIESTRNIDLYDAWGPSEIEARQLLLAKAAVAVWPNKIVKGSAS